MQPAEDHFGRCYFWRWPVAIIGAPGTGNQGPSPAYVFLRSSGGSVDAGEGNVTLRAADLDIQGTLSSANIVSLATSQTGQLVDVGSDTIDSFGLTDAELARITAGMLQIGDANSGPITVSADITRPTKTNVVLIAADDQLQQQADR
jgi:hypothetical protein